MSKTAVLEPRFVEIIAAEVGCRPQQVEAAAELFAEGATVPFVARYRKEATGGLEDLQLETLFKRREYFLELAERRDAILESIREQGKLTAGAGGRDPRRSTTKQELEDLYLPYKPKRRTRAQIAREKGLEPLADAVLARRPQPRPGRRSSRAPFVDPEKGVEDAAAALAGARDILAERLAENAAEHRAELRRACARRGRRCACRCCRARRRTPRAAIYRDYFEHDRAGAGPSPPTGCSPSCAASARASCSPTCRSTTSARCERLERLLERAARRRPAAGRWRPPPRTATSGCCGRRSPTRSAPSCASAPRPRRSRSSAPTWRPCCSRRRSARCR